MLMSRIKVKYMSHTNQSVIDKYSTVLCADHLVNEPHDEFSKYLIDPQIYIAGYPILKVSFSEQSCSHDPIVPDNPKSYFRPLGRPSG